MIVSIHNPDWLNDHIDFERAYASVEERMRLAIELARQNVLHDSGGPFGAAVFEKESGRLAAAGVNRVVPLNNSVLHAEIVAFMMAQARLQSYSLRATNLPAHELVTSCEPCAMCLGASQWAGVERIVYGANRDDAAELRFDEGPVFPESYDYLAVRGLEIVREVLRDEARAVFRLYAERRGTIYNP